MNSTKCLKFTPSSCSQVTLTIIGVVSGQFNRPKPQQLQQQKRAAQKFTAGAGSGQTIEQRYSGDAAPYIRKFTYDNEDLWRTLKDERNVDEDSYNYEYETENKIQAQESGRLYYKGSDAETLKTSGFYQYVGDDGVTYRVDYIADENGFQPVGAHLPTPPPIPPAIQRALDYIAARSAGQR